MHQSVLDFVKGELLIGDVTNKKVLEVGSRDVNGSTRNLIKSFFPGSYTGIDMMAGPGVDVVLRAEELGFRYVEDSFDTVICLETLEHVEFWGRAIFAMKHVLRRGGTMLVTTRSPGFPMHAHPSDFWRFTIEDFRKIFADFDILKLEVDPQADHPGVFLKAKKPDDYKPASLEGIRVRSVG